MRQLLLYISIAILTIACTKDDTSNQTFDREVTITSSIATRVSDEKWVSGDAIGVYMTASTFGDNGANAMYTTSSSAGNFASTAPLYYPTSGTAEIFAYYPYIKDVDLNNYPIVSTQQVDLLSVTKSGVSQSTPAVALVFEHQLSKISLTIKPGNGLIDADLAGLSVKLSNIGTSATYDLTKGKVNSDLDSAKELTLTTSTDGKSASAIVIPQSLDGAKLYFTTLNHGVLYATLENTDFEEGNEYTYTAKLNNDNKVDITESNIDSWNGNTSESGTADWADPDIELKGELYYINSGKGLCAFADLVNGKTNTSGAIAFGSITFSSNGTHQNRINGVLTQNIDLNKVCNKDLGNWTPIGEVNYKYAGTFDGRGYEISGLYVNTSVNQEGIFGYTDTSAIICNVGVSGSVTSNHDSNSWEVGGIAGYNRGTIINCYNKATIKGNSGVGGIAGHNEGTIVNCCNFGCVSGMDDNDKNIGGVVGRNDSYLAYCYSMGEIGTIGTNIGSVLGMHYVSDTTNPTTTGCYGLDTSSPYVIGDLQAAGKSALTADYMRGTTFLGTLNTNAITYNTANPSANYKACRWKLSNTGVYPTLDFGTVAKND